MSERAAPANRQTAEWMKREDERILEFLKENGLASARLIAREAFRMVSTDHVKERMEFLRYAGLVYEAGWRSYELTKAGYRYLNGDLDAAHQPRPTVERVLRG